jgi:biotin transport system substrate-specific component
MNPQPTTPDSSPDSFRMSIYSALFASLMAAGAAIAIPIGPVPIVLQNLFVLLAGLLLGGKWGAASVGIYLLAGALGLPVFSGGTGGIGRFAGPTGGYLIGFLPAVYIVGKTVEKLGTRSMILVLAMIMGTCMIYVPGVIWLKTLTGMSWIKALTVGCIPFLPGDALKIVAAVSIYRVVRTVIRSV